MPADSVVGRPIQVDPAGLLGLLQLKTGGANPAELLGAVRPTIEMLPLWLRQQERVRQANSGIALGPGSAAGFGVFSPNAIVVPENEWWFVRLYSVFSTRLAAGDVLSGLVPAIRYTRVGTVRDFPLCNAPPDPAAWLVSEYATIAENFWAPPGSELIYFFRNVTVAGVEGLTGEVVYVPVPI